jgi:hypothetical protein
VVAAQNILMRKLGLVTNTHVDMVDFTHYIDLFPERANRRASWTHL